MVFATVSLTPFMVGPGCLDALGDPGSTVQNITPAEAYALIQENQGNDKFVFLDVRNPEEYAAGHIDGAENVCLNCVEDFAMAVIDRGRDSTYLIYCRSGNRSATASAVMAGLGFANIYNMTGGMNAWAAAGYPVAQ